MREERMKKAPSELPPRVQRELAALANMPEDKIDTADIPEVLDWSGARRGVFYRPVKQQITLRLDADVVAWFRANASADRGYQTAINTTLRDHVARQLASASAIHSKDAEYQAVSSPRQKSPRPSRKRTKGTPPG